VWRAGRDSSQWQQARRAAFVQDVLAVFSRRPAALLPFDEVHRKLKLGNVHYLGLQDVPLAHIVGSVGRYQDFTRAFLPRQAGLQDRWQRIDRLLAGGASLPPIDLYRVGGVYFVRDGNHRVSVARRRRMESLPAHVWAFETGVALGPDTDDIDALLSRAAHAAFVERTGVDCLCAGLNLRLTQPDGYQDLLDEIEAYRQALSRIDERDLPFDEGVTLWCEMRYEPVVQVIREQDMLHDFPGRTETDLYLWLSRRPETLRGYYRGPISMKEAAGSLVERFAGEASPLRRARKTLRRWGQAGIRRAAGWRGAARRARRRKRSP
jgi:hypothetical protein